MALSIFAAQSGPYASDGARAAGIVEAEDSTLHGIGLEASHAGFDGWGYIAGWDHDGQWVDFHYDAAAAGNYTVDLRYAAGAGKASRLIFVNGQNRIDNQAFASTGSWSSYESVRVTTRLEQGDNTISVIYNSSLGSGNYLNLDRVQIQAAQ
jgi:hypothetical protein